MEKIVLLTIKLKNHLLSLLEQYENIKEEKDLNDRELFFTMKSETESIYQLLDEWESLALQLIKQQQLSIHPHQVVSTRENIELLILHSYYKDARHKRFMQLHQSSNYILDGIIKDAKQKGYDIE